MYFIYNSCTQVSAARIGQLVSQLVYSADVCGSTRHVGLSTSTVDAKICRKLGTFRDGYHHKIATDRDNRGGQHQKLKISKLG